jgi:8-oxo-dGTP diphosphatase
VIRAAGGVVWRQTAEGHREVVLVHRPAYDDWTFPKGKLNPGETEAEAALREVEEETGLRCRLGSDLGSVSYSVGPGLDKSVRYWVMTPVEGSLTPAHEIDRARWVRAEEATPVLTYDHDRAVLQRFADELGLAPSSADPSRAVPVYLIRHGKAGNRHAWRGPDRLRPLSPAGRRQADRLASAFDGRPLGLLLSSPHVRCIQTLAPLAARRGIGIETTEALAEGAPIDQAMQLIAAAARDHSAALCTHGDVMAGTVRTVLGRTAPPPGTAQLDFKKASMWELRVIGGTFTSARYIPPPTSGDPSPDRRPPGPTPPGRRVPRPIPRR